MSTTRNKKAKRPTRPLRLVGQQQQDTIELRAEAAWNAPAAGDGPARTPRLEAVAYTGGMMRNVMPNQRLPIVVDLAGLEIPTQRVPLLRDHKGDRVVGHTVAVQNDGRQLVVAGLVSGSGQDAREIAESARNGFPWQASITATVADMEEIPRGRKVSVNGQDFTGPLLVARSATLKEVSVVSLGADDRTSVRIAAKGDDDGAGASDEGSGQDVNFTPEELMSETDRIKAIYRVVKDPTLAERAVDEGWTPAQARLEELRTNRPRIHAGGTDRRGGVQPREQLSAAFLCLTGQREVGEKVLGAQAMTAGEALGVRCFMDLAANALHLMGHDVPRNRDDLLRASFTTGQLSDLLANVQGKVLEQQLMQNPGTWAKIARVRPVRDFKESSLVRLIVKGGGLEEVGPGGELKHGQLANFKRAVSIRTYGRIFGLSRQQMLNDDLGAFMDLPTIMAMEFTRLLDDLVWGAVVGNAGNHWHSNNANLVSEAGGELSVGGLSKAVRLLREMTDEDDRPLNMPPAVLAVPPALEPTARQLLNSTELGRDDGGPTANPHKGLAELVVEPRLGTAAGGSDQRWYLFGPVQYGSVNLALLNGRASPTVETADQSFDRLGSQWRAYGDAGAALGEPKASVRSDGAAAE